MSGSLVLTCYLYKNHPAISRDHDIIISFTLWKLSKQGAFPKSPVYIGGASHRLTSTQRTDRLPIKHPHQPCHLSSHASEAKNKLFRPPPLRSSCYKEKHGVANSIKTVSQISMVWILMQPPKLTLHFWKITLPSSVAANDLRMLDRSVPRIKTTPSTPETHSHT